MSYFDKIITPNLKGKYVTLSDISLIDKEDYFKLYTDDELNKYWGYDYKKDAKNVDAEYFYNFQLKLKENKEEYSLAIRLKGKMIGEVVMHNFKENSIEIGFRIDKNYQKHGYTFDAVKTLINYILITLKPPIITAKCYHDNIASNNLLLKLGFTKITSDDTYHYFNYLKK